MARRATSWWDYIKAAFSFRFPLPGLGAMPINYLLLAAGLVFALLFMIGHVLTAAAGVLLLTAAYEVLYLYLMTSLPRFRAIVATDVVSRKQMAATGTLADQIGRLGQAARNRFDRMAGICAEIERLLTERQEGSSGSWVDTLKTGGLTDIQTMFTRLLSHQERLQNYLHIHATQGLAQQIHGLEAELQSKGLPEPVRRSKEQTLEVLKLRDKQLRQMAQSYALAGSELDRLEQHLELIRDQAAASTDVAGLAEQIDSVVEGVTDTTSWLLDSEQMLGQGLPAATAAPATVTNAPAQARMTGDATTDQTQQVDAS